MQPVARPSMASQLKRQLQLLRDRNERMEKEEAKRARAKQKGDGADKPKKRKKKKKQGKGGQGTSKRRKRQTLLDQVEDELEATDNYSRNVFLLGLGGADRSGELLDKVRPKLSARATKRKREKEAAAEKSKPKLLPNGMLPDGVFPWDL